ncbi:hypothetical protein [Jannaschia aquimarina]|uniref:Uncharacterized protein n=1 Tax=Jannaschia aquimarina TaxID=935700 RepID=A0A0D1DD36_9RHOB|nr:hypothetical protein [Jannaschia aquimarina]KIT17893.1 hypothetical protein jaqu_03470 [Jannaschia aquimarina]SNT13947.1 hypothetical protein SAMN05421775_106153 [Jannaschia aquimarina]
MSIENVETGHITQTGVDRARRLGKVDQFRLGATARAAALGGSVLPPEVFVVGAMGVVGGAIGGAVAFMGGWSVGLGIVLGAAATMALGVAVVGLTAPRRAVREHSAQIATEDARREELDRKLAAARASGAFDRFGKD